MPAIRISLEQLDALRPCPARRDAMVSAIDWSTPVDAAQAVAAGATLDDIAWVASALARRDPDVDRRLRLWAADCAARVLHIFEREHPKDMRPRNAIISARRYARGETGAAKNAAWASVKDAVWGVAGDAACDAVRNAVRNAARAAAWANWGGTLAAARDAAREARYAAAWDAASIPVRDAEERWQLDRLVARMSANEPEDWPLDKKEAV